LILRDSPEGTQLSGLLDPVAGHTLRQALEAATPTPAIDDTRSRDEHNAEAIAAIARHALDDGAFKAGAPVRPHLALTMDAETFARAREHQRHASHSRASGTQDSSSTRGTGGSSSTRGTGRSSSADRTGGSPSTQGSGSSSSSQGTLRPEGLSGGPHLPDDTCDSRDVERALGHSPVVQLDDGPVLPPSALGRILCSTEITRMVIDADSQVLDVGRSQRLYSGHLRRAVVARD